MVGSSAGPGLSAPACRRCLRPAALISRSSRPPSNGGWPRRGWQPIQTWETPVDTSRRPGRIVGDQQMNAVAQLRGCSAAIGLARTRLLEMGIRDEWPWGAIARRIGMSDKSATSRVVEAIAGAARAGFSAVGPPGEGG